MDDLSSNPTQAAGQVARLTMNVANVPLGNLDGGATVSLHMPTKSAPVTDSLAPKQTAGQVISSATTTPLSAMDGGGLELIDTSSTMNLHPSGLGEQKK